MYGELAPSLELRALKEGREPAALATRVGVFDDLQPYWDGFMWLHETRQAGFELQRITLAEIVAYCELFHVEQSLEWRQDFAEVIRLMDREFLKLTRQRRAAERK